MCDVGVKEVFNSYREGRNVTSGILIANLKGFNVPQHGCPECESHITLLNPDYPYFTLSLNFVDVLSTNQVFLFTEA
jgi:hypothetical protein